MNRRQKKLEKKRKKRDQAKKKARAVAARRPPPEVLIAGAAARAPFAQCYISAGWDDDSEPQLVTVVVTHRLPDERLVAAIALVDRTCLGVKDGYMEGPMAAEELEEFLDFAGTAHGGMEECEPLVAQSIVFHALDYAQRLGFRPHPDFDERLFGPRPETLADTPWKAEERPFYVAGPRDDVELIMGRLEAAVGAGNFDFVDAMELGDDEDDDDEDEDVIDVEAVEVKP
jgi:hypothetical protein